MIANKMIAKQMTAKKRGVVGVIKKITLNPARIDGFNVMFHHLE